MASWRVLEANSDEETRQANDIGSLTSLYEVIKLSILEPDRKVNNFESYAIDGCSDYNYIALSINTSVFVFDENCTTLLLHYNLSDASVDQLLWLPGCEFLLIVDEGGDLHCLHIESKQIIFKRHLSIIKNQMSKKLVVSGKSFISPDETISIVLVSSTGQILRLDNFDKDGLLEGLKIKDLPFLNNLQKQIVISVYDGLPENSIAFCADSVMISCDSKLQVWIGSEDGAYCWLSHSLHNQQPVSHLVANLTRCIKLSLLFNGRYLGAIEESGSLSIICVESGISFWESRIDADPGFTVTDMYQLSSDTFSAQLVVLTKTTNGQVSLQIINIPKYTVTYNIPVNIYTKLLRLGENADAIFFLEPVFTPDSDCVCVKLKSIVDGIPEARLDKLLQKNKFDEAEEFCGTFGLNVEEVQKAKAKYICELINPFRAVSLNTTAVGPEGVTRCFEDLILTLGRIEDNEFVTTLCVEVLLFDLIITEELLLYAKHRLAKASQSEAGDHLSNLMRIVSKNLFSLHTFQMISPSSNICQWLSFAHADKLEEFLEQLEREKFDIASTIWHRHQYEFMNEVDESCVKRILNTIPLNISSTKLCDWLPKNILKDLVKFCPSSMDIIASWTDERIKKLEFTEKKLWPTNGFNLAMATINALDSVASEFLAGGDIEVQMAMYLAQMKAHSPSSCLYHLRQTTIALTDLKILAEKFNVKINYDAFTQDCKASVAEALLDWLLSGEEVAPLMEGFLKSFLLRHNLDCNRVLAKYVEEVLNSSNYVWWLYEEASWEDKVYAIIRIITDDEIQAKAIVECTRLAPAPWSEGTMSMCNLGMSLHTNYTNQLKVQLQLSKLKIVLRRHNLHHINFDEEKNGEWILRNIIRQDKENVLADAMVVVSAFKDLQAVNAYFHRILYFFLNENYADSKALLGKLKKPDLIAVCDYLVNYVLLELQHTPLTIKCRKKIEKYVGGILSSEPILKVNCSKDTISNCTWPKIRRLHLLQTKYNLFLKLDLLDNSAECSLTLENYIATLFSQKIIEAKKEISLQQKNMTFSHLTIGSTSLRGATVVPSITTKTSLDATKMNVNSVLEMTEEMGRLQHLSYLLGLSKEHFFCLLSSLASKNGYLEEAVTVAKHLCEEISVKNVIPIIYDIIRIVVKDVEPHSSEDLKDLEMSYQCKSNLIHIVGNLLDKAFTTCSKEEISDLFELGLWCQMSKILLKQCHLKGIYRKSNTPNDIFDGQNFNLSFIDSTMPIEESAVMKSLSCIFKGLLKVNLEYCHLYRNENVLNVVYDLIHHLKERSQDLLALNVTQMVSTNFKLITLIDGSEYINNFKQTTNFSDVGTLLTKIISSNCNDISLVISLLGILKPNYVFKVLNDAMKRLGYDFSRLLIIGNIGKIYCQLNRFVKIENQFSVLSMRSAWGKRLESMGISFKKSFTGNEKAILEVYKQLVMLENCSFSLIKEFCTDFSWKVNDALHIYLKQCIHNWQPSFIFNEDKLVYDQIPADLCSKIDSIISKIKDSSNILPILDAEFASLSSYNYEMIYLLITHISRQDGCDSEWVRKCQNIIDFLKLYTRQKPPGEVEKRVWRDAHTESEELPTLSKYRLPFHEMCCTNGKSVLKEISTQELSIQSVDQWVRVGDAIQISMDQIYFLTVTSALKANADAYSKCKWQLSGRKSSFLNQILNMIDKIQHLELSSACAHYVTTNLPPGTDKLFAAEHFCKLAQQWKATSDDPKADEATSKSSNKYRQLAIENSLHKFGLAQPEYLALGKNPQQLICNLYQHTCISSLVSTVNAGDMNEINGCVSEICNLIGINQESLQLNLLMEWLPLMDSDSISLDETVSNFQLVLDPIAAQEETSDGQCSLARVIYLLRCYPQDLAVCYLLQQAFTKDETVGSKVKLNALKCLLAIADKEIIQKNIAVPFEDFRLILQTLTYVSRLESLGHPTSISLFESMDKNALVEGLWRSLKHKSEAVILLIDICCDYKITTASLWGAVLSQLTKFTEWGQLEYNVLETVLLKIKNIPHLWLLDQLKVAWEVVISHPFKKVDIPVSPENIAKCIHCINLLIQYCPVSISVDKILASCDTLNLPVLKLTVLSITQRKLDIQELVDHLPKEKLIAQFEQMKLTLVIPKSLEDILAVLCNS